MKVNLNPVHGMYYHSHVRVLEVWAVVSSWGLVNVDSFEKSVSAGDMIDLP